MAVWRAAKMHRRLGAVVMLPLIVVSFTSIVSAASPGVPLEATLDVSNTARFSGNSRGAAELAGVVYNAEKEPGHVWVNVTFGASRVRVLNAPFTVTFSPVYRSYDFEPQETISNETFSGAVILGSPRPQGSYRVLPNDPAGTLHLDLDALPSWTIAPANNWGDFASTGIESITVDHRDLSPAGPAGLLIGTSGASIEAVGDSFVLLYGGTFEIRKPGETVPITSESRLNPSRSIVEPTGTAGRLWYDRTVVVIDGPDVRTSIAAADASRIKTAARSLSGAWKGDLELAGTTGDLRVDGEALPNDSHLLQAIGDFTGNADYSGSSSGLWSFSGTATFVGVDGVTVSGSRTTHLTGTTIAAVAGGLTLLALIGAAFTHLGREVLTFITGRNVAKPLESKARLGFLREISQFPGITTTQLAEKFDMTHWGARYHLGVLKRAHFVDEVQNGGVHTYMLNSHSFKFYADAIGSPSKVYVADAVAELNHPKRRLIHDALKQRGPSHYAKLVEAWKELGVPEPFPSPSDVTYHATKMEEAGLLVRRREGANVVWALNLDLEKVREHQLRAYLAAPATAAVYRSIQSRPSSTLEAILQDIAPIIREKRVTTVKDILVQLEQVGLVRYDTGAGRYAANALV